LKTRVNPHLILKGSKEGKLLRFWVLFIHIYKSAKIRVIDLIRIQFKDSK